METAREYYLAEHFDDPVVKIQNVAVTTLEKFRSGVRKRRNLDPRSLPDDDVRFIDPRYNELFRVPDGSMVQLTFPNGRQYSERVEYLDDYHMRIGSSVQHICEFAEKIARSHATVEPEPLTQQDHRAWNLEYDFYLTVQEDNGLWEYALYQGDCSLLERGKLDAPELMIEEVRDEIIYTHDLGENACIPLSPEEFAQKLADREEIQSYRMKQFRQSEQDCYLLMQLKQDADPNHDELMMLYNTGTRQGLVQELRLMQCYLMPDETALWELSEQVIEKLKLLTDAEFVGLEFPMN